MADDRIEVQFSARTDALKSGMAEAIDIIRTSSEAIAVALQAVATRAEAEMARVRAAVHSTVMANLNDARAGSGADFVLPVHHRVDHATRRGEDPPPVPRGRPASTAAENGRTGAELAKLDLEIARECLAAKAQLGEISRATELDALKKLKEQEFEVEFKALNDETLLMNLRGEELQHVNDKMLILAKQRDLEMQKLDHAAALNMQKEWEQALAPIDRAFSASIRGMLQGTTTLQQALRSSFQSFVISTLENIEKMTVKWIAHELAKSFATDAGNASRTASNVAAAGASGAAEAGAAHGSVLKHAASAAAAVYDDVAQIPYVGWILAPPAAAVAFAGVMAFDALIPSFDVGAWSLPRDMFAAVHAGEMIVPAGPAQSFRDALSGAGSGLGGGDVHVHIHAIDTQTGTEFLARNMNSIAKGLKSHLTLNPSQRPGSHR